MRHEIPDYTLNDADIEDVHRVTLTDAEINQKHPGDIASASTRAQQEYLLGKNEFLIFNLPKSMTKEQVLSMVSLKGVQVQSLSLAKSLAEDAHAFAKVKVGSPAQVKTVKESLRNHWVEDKKIKLKTQDELTYETFNNRTIIVQNFPDHYRVNTLIEYFSSFGAVTGIEMPVKNQMVESEIKHKVDTHVQERRTNERIDMLRAQKLVQDSVRENEQIFREAF